MQGVTSLTVVFLDVSTPTDPSSCSFTEGSSIRSTSSWESVVNHKGVQQLQSWPAAFLPQALPEAHVITLTCSLSPSELRSSKQRGSKVAADLVQAVQGIGQQQWSQQQQLEQSRVKNCTTQQLVLVGHGFGGHLLKEVCLQLQQLAANLSLPACQRQQYACTLASITGLVFYSTPHQPLPRLTLPEYEYVLPDMASVCQRFKAQCGQYGWQTLGMGAAVQGDPSRSVPLSAAAKGMTHFVAVPADQEGVCRPTSCGHPSFVALRQFLQQVMKGPEAAAAAVVATAGKDPDAELPQGMPYSSSPVRLSLLHRLVAA